MAFSKSNSCYAEGAVLRRRSISYGRVEILRFTEQSTLPSVRMTCSRKVLYFEKALGGQETEDWVFY